MKSLPETESGGTSRTREIEEELINVLKTLSLTKVAFDPSTRYSRLTLTSCSLFSSPNKTDLIVSLATPLLEINPRVLVCLLETASVLPGIFEPLGYSTTSSANLSGILFLLPTTICKPNSSPPLTEIGPDTTKSMLSVETRFEPPIKKYIEIPAAETKNTADTISSVPKIGASIFLFFFIIRMSSVSSHAPETSYGTVVNPDRFFSELIGLVLYNLRSIFFLSPSLFSLSPSITHS